jgi:hypothetical protein
MITAALALLLSSAASADATDCAEASLDHHWSLGAQFGAADLPSGHLGIPLAGSEDGAHLAAAVVGSYRFNRHTAIDFGAGLPSSAMGPAFWAGFELVTSLWRDRRGVVDIQIYEDSGLQLGFAGPDYYARTDDEFVGYGYAFGGGVAFAIRLPVGLRLSWAHDSFDTFAEGDDLLLLTPSVENLFELAAGVRVHW